MDSFVVKFYSTVNNDSLRTTVVTQAMPPNRNTIKQNISQLNEYLQGNGIDTSNYETAAATDVSKISSMMTTAKSEGISGVTSTKIYKSNEDKIASLESSLNSTTTTLNSLITSLQQLDITGSDHFQNIFSIVTNVVKTVSSGLNLSVAPAPTTEISRISTMSVSDMYEISTSIENELLSVHFAVYLAGEQNSSYACKFYLSPITLVRLSNIAYSSALDKGGVSLLEKVGIVGDFNAQNVWNSYLIWLLSYVSFGVTSQLYDDFSLASFPGSKFTSVNYMLTKPYLEIVGTLGISKQLGKRNSMTDKFLSLIIPDDWIDFMYPGRVGTGKLYSYLAKL